MVLFFVCHKFVSKYSKPTPWDTERLLVALCNPLAVSCWLCCSVTLTFPIPRHKVILLFWKTKAHHLMSSHNCPGFICLLYTWQNLWGNKRFFNPNQSKWRLNKNSWTSFLKMMFRFPIFISIYFVYIFWTYTNSWWLYARSIQRKQVAVGKIIVSFILSSTEMSNSSPQGPLSCRF